MCRCATSALWYSNGIRADASLHLSLGNTTASVAGAEVRGLAPDEKTFALQLQRALEDDGKAEAAQEEHGADFFETLLAGLVKFDEEHLQMSILMSMQQWLACQVEHDVSSQLVIS